MWPNRRAVRSRYVRRGLRSDCSAGARDTVRVWYRRAVSTIMSCEQCAGWIDDEEGRGAIIIIIIIYRRRIELSPEDVAVDRLPVSREK